MISQNGQQPGIFRRAIGRFTRFTHGHGGGGQGGYEAVESNTKRREPRTRTRSEDRVLWGNKKKTLIATVRDTVRNFNVVAWMCRKHLDYVTTFSFRCQIPSEDELSATVEDFIAKWSRKESYHVAGRHPLRRFMRIAEGRRILDGDFGLLRLAAPRSFGMIKGIESELIKTPPKINPNDVWIDGVKLTSTGRARRYGIYRRKPGTDSTQFQREVNARDLYLHAYYDAVFRDDMIRGISPFAAALNTLRDTHEILDYAKAKMKVAQMFGLVLKREPKTAINSQEADANKDDMIDEINFDDGPQLLDMDIDESAEFLENKTNASEMVDTLQFLMQLSILALDLPITQFDERKSTFFGGRAALMQYLYSTNNKRLDVRDLLDWQTRWRLGLAISEGELILPAGLTFEDLMRWCVWMPAGVPFWDPSKEVAGFSAAIASGLSNFEDVVAEIHGGRASVFDNIERNAKVLKFAREQGFPLTLAGVGQPLDGGMENASDSNTGSDDDTGQLPDTTVEDE